MDRVVLVADVRSAAAVQRSNCMSVCARSVGLGETEVPFHAGLTGPTKVLWSRIKADAMQCF